ncbi:MAG TPA: sulfotransferase [Streptosporangiaceae bacterium]|nr:sulfotransferase [Streptosporangiaceae bacterium]
MTGDSVTTAPPVFVLCGARSGSTLLRFILDAHPELACPPETNIPALCAQLSSVWSLIEGGSLAADRGEEPPEIPDAAITGIRSTVDLMTSSYLARRGARRFCDKSLGTARFADLLTRVYPDAKFLCLYRHPMDMISSGIEACPWGLAGYGFDPYVAGSPGNIVMALTRYWNDNTAAILAVEDRLPDACHRVRYEDLTTDPERTAQEVFGFLGVAPVPGITKECFTAERERTGPADFKIWHTSEVSPSSIGRGWTIPAARIPPQILAQTNDLAVQLGYVQVDGGWGTTAVPRDLRTDVEPVAGSNGHQARKPDDGIDGPGALRLQRLLTTAMTRLDGGLADRWGKRAEDAFGVVVSPAADGGHLRWRIDPVTRTLTRAADEDEDDGTEWDVLGSDRAWEAVLSGSLNIGVALRAQELRYCDAGEEDVPIIAESRIDLLTDFLGLAAWPVAKFAKGELQ